MPGAGANPGGGVVGIETAYTLVFIGGIWFGNPILLALGGVMLAARLAS